MSTDQKTSSKKIVIRSTKVTINGRELSQEDAAKVLVKVSTKITRKTGGVKPSPVSGDTVMVVQSFNKK